VTELAAEPDEALEDGCRAGTPDGDNLVLDYARAEARAFGAMTAAAGGRMVDDDEAGLHLRDMGVGTPFGNVALLTRPVADADTAAVTDRLHTFYDGHPGGPFLVFSPWRTTDWSAAGFVRVGHPPLMFRPAGGAPPIADGLRVVRATDADTLADFERTLIEAYPTPEMQPWERGAMFAPAVLDSDWHFLVGYEGDTAVGTAAAFVSPAITLVELVSTRPECRGRGYGAALTGAARVVAPDQPAMLISSDDGRGVYDGLGYLPLQRYTLWLGLR
jgi:GNAT superfamily N-acetyltransferase